MAKQNGKVPGTFVSETELNELSNLLATYRDYILSHEARLDLIEGWINEYHKMQQESATADQDETPQDSVDLIHEGHDDRIDA